MPADTLESARGALAVLDGAALDAAIHGGGTLAQILGSRVPALRLMRSGDATPACPRFRLRGTRSLMLDSQPDIYLDGALVGNSCILETLPPHYVRRIAVYSAGNGPDGISIRPSAGGMIVITTRVR